MKKILFIFLFMLSILPMSVYASAGDPDTAFNANSAIFISGDVQSVAIQSDGKILVGGNNGFGYELDSIWYPLLRLNTDGTIDTQFLTNLGDSLVSINEGGVEIYDIKIQEDGKIIIGGVFRTNINYGYNIARINSDGTIDNSFNPTMGASPYWNQTVYTLAIQSDGKIVVGGNFTSILGTSDEVETSVNRVARLNSNGTIDTTFATNIGTGLNNEVYTTAIQSDGKILLGGFFTSIDGNTSNRIARLNSDGTPDTTFTTNIGTGFSGGVVETLATQSDGKIVVGGNFTSINGNTSNHIARLNSNGTPDTTFTTNIGTGFDDIVRSVAIQSNDKIIAVGRFQQFNSNLNDALVRLGSNGLIDNTFYLAGQNGGNAYSVVLQGNVKVFVGATSAGSNGVAQRITRFNSDVIVPTVTTLSALSITTTTATLNGNITNTGGESNTARGFNIGLNTSYAMTSISESGSYSTGAYTGSATGLTCNTTYHYRAYSTNTAGTSYGSDTTFTTSACPVVGGSVPVWILQAQSDALLQQQNLVNQNENNTKNSGKVVPAKYIFKKNLKLGSRDQEVIELQKYLNSKGFIVSEVGNGSIGKESNYFGIKTKNALVKFQAANNIKPALGYFGPLTRNFVNNN